MEPRFPLYIPSKGRADTRLTVKALDRMGVPYHVVVEEQEYEQYAMVIAPSRLLILDPAYQRDYDTCDALGDAKSKGSGPARNFIWDHAAATGAEWHWIMDDNIHAFYRLNRNTKIQVRDGSFFRVQEDFTTRYQNVSMSGPHYEHFVLRRDKKPPFITNTRIYSCNLIRTDAPFRWRGRFNEDTILSLDMLKAGWCTVLFCAYLQNKVATQRLKGGNTDALYQHGTLEKSQMMTATHPDVCRVVWKFNRWHHHCDYRPFKYNRLIKRADAVIPEGVNEYGMKLVRVNQPAESAAVVTHGE